MEVSDKYDINFFTPHTPFLKDATKLIWIGITVWFFATYGFQTLLKVIEEPTPEAGYLVYEKVYPKLTQGTATPEELVSIGNVYLGLVGKSIALQKNAALKNAFTATVQAILPADQKDTLTTTASEAATNKKVDTAFIAAALGVSGNEAMKAAIPYALAPIDATATAMVNPGIPAIMDKYLIHNQSVLTDTIVLGFPFHYLYTALFLLILFVMICLIYCRAIDKVMKKYDLEQSFE